ncbi:MAG: DUF357 domain-containing protein [Candidatus Woesearchaeota archaeon]
MDATITAKDFTHALAVTKKALEKAKIAAPQKTHLARAAADFYEMAEHYLKDAEYFYSKQQYKLAFGALYYAHGWLDAGARLGLFDVDHDNTLFTVE